MYFLFFPGSLQLLSLVASPLGFIALIVVLRLSKSDKFPSERRFLIWGVKEGEGSISAVDKSCSVTASEKPLYTSISSFLLDSVYTRESRWPEHNIFSGVNVSPCRRLEGRSMCIVQLWRVFSLQFITLLLWGLGVCIFRNAVCSSLRRFMV